MLLLEFLPLSGRVSEDFLTTSRESSDLHPFATKNMFWLLNPPPSPELIGKESAEGIRSAYISREPPGRTMGISMDHECGKHR